MLALDWNMVDEETVRCAGGLQTEVVLWRRRRIKLTTFVHWIIPPDVLRSRSIKPEY